ncbi:MAG: [FeFe] hydrogenase H-cluster maturation GTPase HydF [Myxococcota bacterium]
MRSTPKAQRLSIGLFGRRNVGKSSLLNALTGQDLAIVSPEAGTTTDPVEKPMELLPLGPVVFIDTAGLDDEGLVGQQRVHKSRLALGRVDIALVVAEGKVWTDHEASLLDEVVRRGIQPVVCFNKIDLGEPDPKLLRHLRSRGVAVVEVSASQGWGIDRLREALFHAMPQDFYESQVLMADLVPPGKVAVLVMPVDSEAPRGRLILPQAQAVRDLLDQRAISVVCQDTELPKALAALREPPALVVTDSQAFAQVSAATPPGVPLTSFSILFARMQADLTELARGTAGLARLRDGDRVLLAEACTHHPTEDDIARVKIPRWLEKKTGAQLGYEFQRGHEFPEDLTPWRAVVHCGGCMANRREMRAKLWRAQQQGVAMTNFGMTIAWSLGILDRALGPFPEALAAYHKAKAEVAATAEVDA